MGQGQESGRINRVEVLEYLAALVPYLKEEPDNLCRLRESMGPFMHNIQDEADDTAFVLGYLALTLNIAAAIAISNNYPMETAIGLLIRAERSG